MTTHPQDIGAEHGIVVRVSPQFVAAARIAARLRDAGEQAVLAGGCVRDILLGRAPKDYDVATSAQPSAVLRMFARTEAVGAQFGVVLVMDEIDGARVMTEVATFRSDGDYLDGRRPEHVTYTTSAAMDAQRRDFTINGMMLDLAGVSVAAGQTELLLPVSALLDFVGGRADLDSGTLRAIGDPERRFTEDKLRLLRAVRFAARLGFTIEAATMRAMQRLAPAITQVSPERIRDELTRMLTEGAAKRAFELLHESGLLRCVLPEVDAMRGVEQPPEYHPEGDVWVHTLLLLQDLPNGAPATLAWGALLHDVGKPPTFQRAPDRIRFNGHAEVGAHMAREICNRLRFSNAETAQIVALVANHMRFGDVKAMRESTRKRFFRMLDFPQHLELHRLDCAACHRNFGLYEYAREQFRNQPPEAVRPALLVTGTDLIRAGYKPGPRFKEMLTAAEDAQLEGDIASTAEGLALVRKLFPYP